MLTTKSTWKNIYVGIRDSLLVVVIVAVITVEAVGHVAKQLEAGTHAEQELAQRLPEAAPVLVT
jgi:hypothetical protein